MRARALRAPVFLSSLPRKTGGCAPTPLPNAASLLLIRPQKIYKIYRTWAAHVKGFFLSTGPHADCRRLWNMRSAAHAPPIAALLILPAIFWGQNYVPVRPNALIFFGFSFFYIVFYLLFLLFSSFSSLLFISFLFISFYPSLLISSFSSSYRYYSLSSYSFFLYFKLIIVLQTWYLRHSEGFFEGAKPFLIHLGSKLMYTFFFLSVFWSFLLVTLFLFFSSYLSSYSSLLIFMYCRHAFKYTLGKGTRTYITGKTNYI